VVASGLSGQERSQLEAKRVLRLLGEIDDDQIVMLSSFLVRYESDQEFRELHRDILIPPDVTTEGDEESENRAALHGAAVDHLVRLGLLREHYGTVFAGEKPAIDKNTGIVIPLYKELSPLGRLLLRHIGLAEADEF